MWAGGIWPVQRHSCLSENVLFLDFFQGCISDVQQLILNWQQALHLYEFGIHPTAVQELRMSALLN